MSLTKPSFKAAWAASQKIYDPANSAERVGQIFGLMLLLCTSFAQANELKIPQLEFNNYNLVNLSGKDFYQFLNATDKVTREKAQMYMVGVWDSTEGKSWCGFNMFKSTSLQEMVYRHFDKLPAQRLNERASKLIEEALAKNHPCKGQK